MPFNQLSNRVLKVFFFFFEAEFIESQRKEWLWTLYYFSKKKFFFFDSKLFPLLCGIFLGNFVRVTSPLYTWQLLHRRGPIRSRRPVSTVQCFQIRITDRWSVSKSVSPSVLGISLKKKSLFFFKFFLNFILLLSFTKLY